jgi:DNA (cytosine-5)-methyltransferase 1
VFPDTPDVAATVVRKLRSSEWVEDDTGSTLAARDYKDTGDVVVQPAVLLTMREGAPGGGKGPLLVEEESLTLATGNGQTLFQPQVEQYGVRRLTPVECERLQAFPDGWTEPAVSDSARYKALGNAVTVNTVRWVLGRMLEQS